MHVVAVKAVRALLLGKFDAKNMDGSKGLARNEANYLGGGLSHG